MVLRVMEWRIVQDGGERALDIAHCSTEWEIAELYVHRQKSQ